MTHIPSHKFKFRRDTTNRWSAVNPILGDGEPGFERDTGRLKIGDGVQRWNDLEYFIPIDPTASDADLPSHINSETPHPVYDDGPDLSLLYENAKV